MLWKYYRQRLVVEQMNKSSQARAMRFEQATRSSGRASKGKPPMPGRWHSIGIGANASMSSSTYDLGFHQDGTFSGTGKDSDGSFVVRDGRWHLDESFDIAWTEVTGNGNLVVHCEATTKPAVTYLGDGTPTTDGKGGLSTGVIQWRASTGVVGSMYLYCSAPQIQLPTATQAVPAAYAVAPSDANPNKLARSQSKRQQSTSMWRQAKALSMNLRQESPSTPVAGAPVVLPEGWEMMVDPVSGRPFFVDHNTQTTHWQLPPPPVEMK